MTTVASHLELDAAEDPSGLAWVYAFRPSTTIVVLETLSELS